MVSKRQKLARKRYFDEHPELRPQPQPPKEKKAKKAKRKSSNKPSKCGSKHPLRVPGMRPGESCFICKSKDHIAKLCPEKSMWEKNKICLLCRQRGHSLQNCPGKGEDLNKKICYNCGEAGHSLSRCPLPRQEGGTKFASCFVCNEHGHLSKDCPKNTHGIYPKGGSCKVCGGITHLAKDCPNKGSRGSLSSTGMVNTSYSSGGQLGKRTVFHSGDDLEDDFTTEDTKTGKEDAKPPSDAEPVTDEAEKNIPAKTKKKQAPKVVNFLG